jgi:hypothetical protein
MLWALAIAAGSFIVMAAVSQAFHRLSAHASRANGEASISDSGVSRAAPQNAAPAAKPGDAPEKFSRETERTDALPNAAAVPVPERKKFSPAQKLSELNDVIDGDRPKDEKLGVALATLETSDKEVRAAALEAVRELDDRDAIPQLQQLAAETDDPAEKAALLDAADFLNLPSFLDHATAHQGSGRIIPKTSTKLSERAALLRQARQNGQVGGGPTPAAAQP